MKIKLKQSLKWAIIVVFAIGLFVPVGVPVYAQDNPPPPDGGAPPAESSPAPSDSGGESAPSDSGGESAPSDSGGESAPSDSGGESAPSDSGGESAPSDSGGESAPPDSGGESAPSDSGGESAPPDSGGESAPSDSGGESAPPDSGGSDSEETPIAELLVQAAEQDSEIVVLDEEGEEVPLASKEAMEALSPGSVADPWFDAGGGVIVGYSATGICLPAVTECNTSSTPIQDALDDSRSDGKTVYVEAGTYNENIVIRKTVSLVGAGAATTFLNGVSGGEAVVTILTNGSSILLSGFTITSVPGEYQYAILFAPHEDDDFFVAADDEEGEDYLEEEDTPTITIEENVIQSTFPIAGSMRSVYGEGYGHTLDFNNNQVTTNGYAMDLNGFQDSTIANNVFTGKDIDLSFTALVSLQNFGGNNSFLNNTVQKVNQTASYVDGLYIGGYGTGNWSITHNLFNGAGGDDDWGIYISGVPYESNIQIHYNDILNWVGFGVNNENDFVPSFSLFDEETDFDSGEFIVDARWNCWGSASGPYHPDLNPGATGSPVSDNVLFDPWLDCGVDGGDGEPLDDGASDDPSEGSSPSGLPIPVTGGGLVKVACDEPFVISLPNGDRVLIYGLCGDFWASLVSESENTLPQNVEGFFSGMTLQLFKGSDPNNLTPLTELPEGARIVWSFVAPPSTESQNSLFWQPVNWNEVPHSVNGNRVEINYNQTGTMVLTTP
ncbi:MAG: hypothetical protein HPY45_16650 [Anaerolineae bacterium]|nr:hypothetical protein [Anaerolineae bacterium]